MQQESDGGINSPADRSPAQVPLAAPTKKARAKPKTASKPAIKGKAGRPRGLGAFDYDVLKLIKRGTRSIMHIITLLGVDEGEANQRIELLIQKGLVKKDPADSGLLSFTVKAYNEFQPSSLELSTERKALKKAQNPASQQPPALARQGDSGQPQRKKLLLRRPSLPKWT